MVQKQEEERRQIKKKFQELDSTTNVEKVQTVYESAISDIKRRLQERKEYAEKFKGENLKTLLGKGDEEEGEADDEEEGGKGVIKDSSPAVDYRKKYFEKEELEFSPFYDLQKGDDFSEFELKSKYWDEAKKKRFQIKKMKYLTKEYEDNQLSKIKETIKGQARSSRPKSEWITESKPYPKPIKYDKKGKPVYDTKEVSEWQEEYKKQQELLKEREKKKFHKRSPEEEQLYQKNKKEEYDKMIKQMRKE